MNARERFFATIDFAAPDRLPTRHYGTPEVNQALMDHFGLRTQEDLLQKVGDDFRGVSPVYIGPELGHYPDGSWEGLWGERYTNWSFGGGSYPEAVYLPYAEITDPAQLDGLRKPSPDWYDYSQIPAEIAKLDGFVVCTGGAGMPDFMNGIARCRGVERVMLDVGEFNSVYLRLVEERFAFFYEMYRRVLEAGQGKIDLLCMGEDYGNQNGLNISPRAFERIFAPRMQALFALAHQYGAKTMMHCCGSCRQILSRLIEIGLDILDVVQVDAAGMEINDLHAHFYGKISFCGSVSVQNTLPFGSVADVQREVELRKRLFGQGGMVIAATHDIQVGTPIENIVAMYRSIGSLRE